ncbi:MAG: indole-3-glycerol phosphate synthase TrpC [Bacteroidales bacterium]
MSILDEIVLNKKQEVAEQKELYPVKLLERSIYFNSQPLSLSEYILRPDLSGIIAEFKRKSPSKGVINEYAKPEQVCLQYMQAGASALSVLTDSKFFGGHQKDLTTARKFNYCPILRKDFIVDEYQIVEAKSIGADAILLIAEILTAEELLSLATFAKSLGLQVLFEVHSEENIGKLPADASIVGINNRNLKNFEVNIDHSASLLQHLPNNVVKVAESGIDSAETLISLKSIGFDGFLIGEKFMRESNPGKACGTFVNRIKELEQHQAIIQ